MLMELVMFGEYYNQAIVNRFTYDASGTPAAVSFSFALINAFGGVPATPGLTDIPSDGVLSNILECLNDSFTVTSLYARRVLDNLDFYELPYTPTLSGTLEETGGHASPAIAYGFRTNRVRTDIRRGTKRFPGVIESAMLDGGSIGPGQLGLLNTAAASMSAVLTYDDEGNTLTFAPCIAGREKYPTPGGTSAYRYYQTEEAQNANLATGILWSPYTTVRTQTSRQYGQGR